MRKKIKYSIILILGLLLIYVAMRSPEGKNGKIAPDFQAELISGEDFSLHELKGSYVLLDFWGSWCAPCRRENPSLARLYDEYKDKSFKNADAFHVVTVALEKSGDSWRRAAEKDGFVWPYQIVQKSRIVLMSPLAQRYAVSNIPAKFLIGPDGRILGVNQKFDEIRELLAAQTK